METLYLVDKANFAGSINTSVTDGYADFSGYLYNNKGRNLTVEEYRQLPGNESLELATGAEVDQLFQDWCQRTYLDQPVKEITKERFWEMLEVLPPGGWVRGTLETFYMIERQHGNITRQFGRLGNRYIEKFIDLANRETWIKAADFPD